VTQKRLLDSFAIIAYLNKEKGFEKVRDVLSEAQESGKPVIINDINIGEVYYILFRKRGPEKTNFFLETILPSLPVQVFSNDFNDVIRAAKIKAEHPLSFADYFAVATAGKEKAVIMTGDPEFKRIEKLVTIEWLEK